MNSHANLILLHSDEIPTTNVRGMKTKKKKTHKEALKRILAKLVQLSPLFLYTCRHTIADVRYLSVFL